MLQMHFWCSKCRNHRSLHHGRALLTTGSSQPSFFGSLDKDARINRRINPRAVLALIYFVAKERSPAKINEDLQEKYRVHSEAITNWASYIREIVQEEFDKQTPMGGPGEEVEIDECYLKGKRKYNRGRLLGVDKVAPGCNKFNNYKDRSSGPWVLGIKSRATREVRFFALQDRSATTLIPLIETHVAPGSTIYTDEWRAYRPLAQSNKNYRHITVNHKENFVDPHTGAHTQGVERSWVEAKNRMVRLGRGTCRGTLKSQLALQWFYSIQGPRSSPTPFKNLIKLISKKYPS